MKLNVVSLFRDSEGYLAGTFRNLEEVERRHAVHYFFYENDSLDDTVLRLREWMRTRRGVVISETLGARKFGQTTEPERTAAMASYRNTIRAAATRVDSDWTLLLDSDVEFPESIVEQYLSSNEQGVAMYTPYVALDRTCRMCDPTCQRPAYYDAFALRDRSGRPGMILSCNPFWDDEDRRTWERGMPVEVNCAFGGAALVRSDVLAACQWRSDGDCEHVAFAGQVRTMGRILVMPTVRTSTKGGEAVARPETFQMQRRLLENPLLLRFWTERNRGVVPSGERRVTYTARATPRGD